jgi:hypothetical protein
MPALDSPGFPIHLTPHDLKQPAESSRPKSADKEGKAAKTGNYQAPDKTSKDEQSGSSRGAGANVRPSSVSPPQPAFFSCPHHTHRGIVQSYVIPCFPPRFEN